MDIGAVLFAAGRGTRLRPLTDLVPKPVVPLLDVPLALIALDRLRTTCPLVVVNLSHLPEVARRALEPVGEEVEFLIEEPEPFGSAGTLAHLRQRVRERVVVHNGDLLTDLLPGALLSAHAASGAPATIAVTEVSEGADLVISGGRATRFIDRRREPAAPGVRYLGMAVFERAALDLLPEPRSRRSPIGLGEALLAPLVERGDVSVMVHEGYATDVGTPARYLTASIDALDGALGLPEGGWPGRSVRVEEGLSYLGPGAVCQIDSLGPGAIVLAGAQVNAGARVTRSIVWPGENIPPGTRLAGAIWARSELLQVSLP